MEIFDYHHLPGGELITPGIADINAGRITIPSLLISIAWTALKQGGIPITRRLDLDQEAELVLYSHLRKTEGNNAHSKYNSLLRRLTSFQHALLVSR